MSDDNERANAFTESFSRHTDVIETEPDALGYYWQARIERDDSMGYPWEEHDGHGIVRRVSRFDDGDKAPGERILYRGNSREYTFLYDVAASIQRAREEDWGCAKHEHATKGEERACAVDQDFDYLRRFLDEDWYWVGVALERLRAVRQENGMDVVLVVDGAAGSLWGIDSDSVDYLTDCANDLLDEAKGDELRRILTELRASIDAGLPDASSLTGAKRAELHALAARVAATFDDVVDEEEGEDD